MELASRVRKFFGFFFFLLNDAFWTKTKGLINFFSRLADLHLSSRVYPSHTESERVYP